VLASHIAVHGSTLGIMQDEALRIFLKGLEAIFGRCLTPLKRRGIGPNRLCSCSLEGQIDGIGTGRGSPVPDAFRHSENLSRPQLDTLVFKLQNQRPFYSKERLI
jgi:hypothetical protein